MITINMNNAALCRLEQQDRARPGAMPERRTTAVSTGLPEARAGAPAPETVPPMPEHTRG